MGDLASAIGKGKDAVLLLMERKLISLSQAIGPVGGYTSESVTHGQP